MPKKILIVSKYFYPTNSPRSFRTTELAKELARQGHQVKVITPDLGEEQHNFAKAHHIKLKKLKQVKSASFLNKLPRIINRVMTRLLQLLFEYPDIKLITSVKKALRDEKGYDLLISVAVPYPIHWGVASVWKKYKPANVWVADCGDPFMGDESDSFKHPFYFKYLEQKFCRHCDFITVPTKASIDGYYKEFRHKIKVIPQGFKFEEIEISNEKNDILSFGYAGNFIKNYREPFAFLDYLCHTNIDFKFYVYTSKRNFVKPYVKKLGDNLVVNQYIPRKALLKEFSKLDFVVNFDNKGSKQTPSKLIDYYIINKPILNIPYESFPRDTVNQFLHRKFNNQLIIENPGQYKIENVTKQFINLIAQKE